MPPSGWPRVAANAASINQFACRMEQRAAPHSKCDKPGRTVRAWITRAAAVRLSSRVRATFHPADHPAGGGRDEATAVTGGTGVRRRSPLRAATRIVPGREQLNFGRCTGWCRQRVGLLAPLAPKSAQYPERSRKTPCLRPRKSHRSGPQTTVACASVFKWQVFGWWVSPQRSCGRSFHSSGTLSEPARGPAPKKPRARLPSSLSAPPVLDGRCAQPCGCVRELRMAWAGAVSVQERRQQTAAALRGLDAPGFWQPTGAVPGTSEPSMPKGVSSGLLCFRLSPLIFRVRLAAIQLQSVNAASAKPRHRRNLHFSIAGTLAPHASS